MKVLVAQSCLTLCDPMDGSPPGSSVLGDSPGKNTGVGCHALLKGIFLTQALNSYLLHCRQILYPLNHLGSPLSAAFLFAWFLPVFLYLPASYFSPQLSDHGPGERSLPWPNLCYFSSSQYLHSPMPISVIFLIVLYFVSFCVWHYCTLDGRFLDVAIFFYHQYLTQCLEHRRCSISICWTKEWHNELTREYI